MKLPTAFFCLVMGFLSGVSTLSNAQSTAFTYQGRLNSGGAPATGSFDFTFALFDSSSNGAQQGITVTNTAAPVLNGIFTTVLDFGNQFPGADRWLEIGVRTNGGAPFATLNPRQQISSAPYSIKAASASAIVSDSTVKYSWVNASNGLVALPAANIGDPALTGPTGISFYNTNGSPMADIWTWANHGGNGQPELLIESANTIALRPGQSTQYDGYGEQGGLQLGAQGYAPLFYLQKESDNYNPAYDGLDLPHSHRLAFAVPTLGNDAHPGIVGFADPTATTPSGYRQSVGRLRFYSVLPEKYPGFGYSLTLGAWNMEVSSNGVTVKGDTAVSGLIMPTNGMILTSNSYPITSWAALGNCGTIFWQSNATLYAITTNSIAGSAVTNWVAGFK